MATVEAANNHDVDSSQHVATDHDDAGASPKDDTTITQTQSSPPPPSSPNNADAHPDPDPAPGPSTRGLESQGFNMRADPDAQATVTDYLDFTEYLPADMTRSLTLIGKLDQTYINESSTIDELTTLWAKLPTLPVDQRPAPAELRADISRHLDQSLSARTYAYAEACRMNENVIRHYHKVKTILSKLQIMRENYDEQPKSPVQSKSPQLVRAPKITLRVDSNGQKVQRPPRITVPGEVLAPYEIDFNTYSSESDESSDEDIPATPPRHAPASAPRIKIVKTPKISKQKVPKPPRPPRASLASGTAAPVSTSTALAQLKPPPDNAVPGSTDAPWLQLTPYELAKLRKRMKKNAVWSPSDTMIARELKALGRGVEAFKAAQKKAEDEGKPFEPNLPAPVVDAESGAQHPPEGAISADALTADEVQLSNRGMKLNEAKKLKREALAKMAADEAEESARKMTEAVRMMFLNQEASPSAAVPPPEKASDTPQPQAKASSSKSQGKKRKRDSMSQTPVAEKPEGSETQQSKPQLKRNKTETPVPPPQLAQRPTSVPPLTETPVPVPQPLTSKTPVPVPVPISSDSSVVAARTATPPAGGASPVPPPTVTTTVPTKPPAGTPVSAPKTSTTPILPPTRELPKRETRQNLQLATTNLRQSTSRGNTPSTTPVLEPQSATTSGTSRRPTSRGKAASQEPAPILAVAERPRRASTARNTPAPEQRQPSKRAKRPAPGVVTTNPGGTSAVGKRKAAPRKKARGSTRKTSQPPEQDVVEVEVDDDGNVIDPNEPRYCLCNGVSFGTMIQCDNVDVSEQDVVAPAAPAGRGERHRSNERLTPHKQNCKYEWFHLGCVGLSEIPARTTKWYCPECRVLLNIGGRGEVTSRGVKM